ncbi:hypothetical protein GY45DRAFT_1436274 [Cubamyces sp. BRFM 1775]|nr:hypothetical protein GY45DRAFT_1436274 [Cubamyces sp. BRFM 1775]
MSDPSRQQGRVDFHDPDPAEGIVDIPGLGVFYHSAPPDWEIPLGSDHRYDQAGGIHYVPPTAVSTKYYALSNPNEYVTNQPANVIPSAAPAPVTALRGHNQAATHSATDVVAAAAFDAQWGQTANAATNSFATSGTSESQNPVLPKQRRNRDHPSGGSGQLAQTTANYEIRLPSRHQEMGRLGSEQALLAYDNKPYTAIAVPHVGVKIRDPKLHEPSAGSSTAVDPDVDMNRYAIYSPTTGRKIPLGVAGSSRGTAQMVPSAPPGPISSPAPAPAGMTIAKKPYKRGTPVACTFCRKRKIACGGPVEGDEEGRCGRCIQRRQACEFPPPAQRPSSRMRQVSGYTGPVVVNEWK